MLRRIALFLNRPMAGDFSLQTQLWSAARSGGGHKAHQHAGNDLRTQLWSAARSGGVVLVVILLLGGGQFRASGVETGLLLLLTAGVTMAVFVAGYVVPKLMSRFYDEDRWTVWKQASQVPVILLLVSTSNQLVLFLTGNEYPSFGWMYWNVLQIGILPATLDILLTEQRQLRRNLTHAQTLNEQLAHQTVLMPEMIAQSQPVDVEEPAVPPLIVLTFDSGKERLSLHPDQVVSLESVGNYVEVNWLNKTQPQKTILRSTLKEMAESLVNYPQFFRCHRAFLINLKAVRQTEGNARGYQLTLDGISEKVPVSRGYLNDFDEQLKRVM